VDLISCPAGEHTGEADLYVVDKFNNECNRLRPPATPEPVRTARVPVRRLDDILSELEISRVDFIKLDAEGAELSVLYTALKLLNRGSRPAMLVEAQDVQTRP
jgi:FkbM family methyltransferase